MIKLKEIKPRERIKYLNAQGILGELMPDDFDHELERLKAKKLFELTSNKNGVEKMSHEVELNVTNFDSVISAEKLPIIVDFWATWCGPCMYMGPIFEKMAEKYVGKVVFGKLNVDENSDIAGRFGVYGIPTFIIFKDGKEIRRVVGAVGENGLESELNKLL
ncbi:MAG: thioredoxin, partial [Candidatus Methanomethylicus sp.]|nr:thioredoxin [Candidatus Methanomethylicus sp.]